MTVRLRVSFPCLSSFYARTVHSRCFPMQSRPFPLDPHPLCSTVAVGCSSTVPVLTKTTATLCSDVFVGHVDWLVGSRRACLPTTYCGIPVTHRIPGCTRGDISGCREEEAINSGEEGQLCRCVPRMHLVESTSFSVKCIVNYGKEVAAVARR